MGPDRQDVTEGIVTTHKPLVLASQMRSSIENNPMAGLPQRFVTMIGKHVIKAFSADFRKPKMLVYSIIMEHNYGNEVSSDLHVSNAF